MNRDFMELAERCTRSLNGDPELRRDVTEELAGHLEDKAAELEQNGLAPAAAIRDAIHEFGPPEEIDRELLAANWSRLKRRARVKWAFRLLAGPLLLMLLFWSLNLPLLRHGGWFLPDSWRAVLLPEPLAGWVWRQTAPSYSARAKLLTDGGQSRIAEPWLPPRIAAQRAIWESDPGNPVFLAHYLVELSAVGNHHYANPAFQSRILAEFDTARRLDPDNALYDYLPAALELAQAARVESSESGPDRKNRRQLKIEDRDRLDRAMAMVREGAAKPGWNDHAGAFQQAQSAALNLGGSVPDRLRRMWIERMDTSLGVWRFYQLVMILPLYAELLEQEGKPELATVYADLWQPILRQSVTRPDWAPTELYFWKSWVVSGQAAAEQRGDRARAQAIAGILESLNMSGRSAADHAQYQAQRGWFSQLIWLPEFGGYTVSNDDLRPERRLSYAVFDGLAAAAFTGVMLLILALLLAAQWLLRCNGQRGIRLTLRWRDYGQIALWGILTPLAVYYGCTRIEAISGRAWGPEANLPRSLASLAVLALGAVWFIILMRRKLTRRARELGWDSLSAATAIANLLPALTVFTLAAGIVLGTLARWEQQHYAASDRLILSDQIAARQRAIVRQQVLDRLPEPAAALPDRDAAGPEPAQTVDAAPAHDRVFGIIQAAPGKEN